MPSCMTGTVSSALKH
uniref:Uncharacterized protein n=1 Tax=Anguilla anguilla TaxID=7936 RepID=A0A0E9QR51_ANGAN